MNVYIYLCVHESVLTYCECIL